MIACTIWHRQIREVWIHRFERDGRIIWKTSSHALDSQVRISLVTGNQSGSLRPDYFEYAGRNAGPKRLAQPRDQDINLG